MSQALVGIIMGSKSDWPVMQHAAEMLERLGVPYEAVSYTHLDVYKRQRYARHAAGEADCLCLSAWGEQ